MKNISKTALITSKVFEIFHWILSAFMAAILLSSVAAGDWLSNFLAQNASERGLTLSSFGFEVMAADSAGNVNMAVVPFFSIGAILVAGLMALAFRNVYLMIKRSKKTTPFQKDNIRMLKNASIFLIATSVVGLVTVTVIRLVTGIGEKETCINLDGFVMGVLLFCITEFFAHGIELQDEVDGLL